MCVTNLISICAGYKLDLNMCFFFFSLFPSLSFHWFLKYNPWNHRKKGTCLKYVLQRHCFCFFFFGTDGPMKIQNCSRAVFVESNPQGRSKLINKRLFFFFFFPPLPFFAICLCPLSFVFAFVPCLAFALCLCPLPFASAFAPCLSLLSLPLSLTLTLILSPPPLMKSSKPSPSFPAPVSCPLPFALCPLPFALCLNPNP